MQVSTPEQFKRRQDYFDGLKIKNLKRKYLATGDKKYLVFLQNMGIDCDYIPGKDDGEEPEGRVEN